MALKTTLKNLGRDLNRTFDKMDEMETIATVRTMNAVAGSSKNMLARDVNMDTGIAIGTAKRRIKVDKATKRSFHAALIMKDSRVTYPSPRQLKKGASFLSTGKKRVKVTTAISTPQGKGSKPFVIKGRHSGKKLPVYVIPSATRETGTKKRKVQAMYFHSIPHVARKDWNSKVQTFARLEFRRLYPGKLKSAKRGY